MRTSDFDFELPEELIAQNPTSKRDESRLLAYNRSNHTIQHQQFSELPQHLQPGDLLVVNDSQVIRARIRGMNRKTGGRFEMLLHQEEGTNDWWAMIRPGKRAKTGTEITILNRDLTRSAIIATVVDQNDEGHRRLQFTGTPNILSQLESLGEIPLPPYIRRNAPQEEDAARYQTVYAREAGSVAAPTAGLHFTTELLENLKTMGVSIAPVTLHVGLGTFAPVKAADLSDHVMHVERYSISPSTALTVNTARSEGRRIIAVGTTSLRVLESAASDGKLEQSRSSTRLFVKPPYEFQLVDALITNFHLPCSTLLMLVSAFLTPGQNGGREQLLSCYAEAVKERYRFFSYGDAMFIT